jgi:hypothetical protein
MNHYNRTWFITPSTFLVCSNLFIIAFALLAHWSITTLLWGYWLQSIVIGFFTVLKLLPFGSQKTPRYGLRSSLRDTIFFTCHYGIFHVAYLIILYLFTTSGRIGMTVTPPDYGAVGLIGFLFFLTHCYSFAYHYLWEGQIVVISPNQLLLDPYKRIFPMHLTIIAAGFFSLLIPPAESSLLIVFLILKTFADLKSHEVLHQSDTYPTFHHHL